MKNKISAVIGFLVLAGLISWNVSAFSAQRQSRESLLKVRADFEELTLRKVKLDENEVARKDAFKQAQEDRARWDRILAECDGFGEWVVAYPDRIQSSYGNEPMGKRTVRLYVPEGKYELAIKFRVDPFGTLDSWAEVEKMWIGESVESRTLTLEGGKSYELDIEFVKSDGTVDKKGYGDGVLTEMRITIVGGEVLSFPLEPATRFSSGEMGDRVRVEIPGKLKEEIGTRFISKSNFEIGTLTYGFTLSENDKMLDARLRMFVRSEGPRRLVADDREFQYLLDSNFSPELQFDEEKFWYYLPLSHQETQAGEQ